MPTPDDLLAALDPEQRQVAEALRGPVRVLAGAGTGKTRAITHRIAYGVATGVYAPTEVLAVTFTTRAAGEMRGRLRALGAGGVQARTFHSAALRQLRYFWPRVHGTELPDLIESKLGLLAARRPPPAARTPTRRCCATSPREIEWAKVSNVSPRRLRPGRRPRGRSVSPASTPRPWPGSSQAYEEVKRDQGRMDMEDVLLLTAGLLADDERVAAQVRRQYKWFVVDEFQDVSPLQSALLDLWLGGRDELCVVGDPAQTIYSFAGANATYLRDFPSKYPGATSIELVRNYRSTPADRRRGQQTAGRHREPGRRAASPSGRPAPRSPTARTPTRSPRPTPSPPRSPPCARRGIAAGEIAVLFRINAQSEAFEDALAQRSIPYVVRGAARFFDRPEVRQAVTLLRGAARGGTGRGQLDDLVRATLSGMGWTHEPPGHPRPDPRPLGVPAGAGRPGRGVRPRAHGGRRSATSSTTSTGVPPSSTRRSPTASPSRPCTPPRAWSGTPSSCAACRTAPCRSPTPRPRPRSRRSAGCSTSASPGPASTCRSRGRWPATPAAAGRASRRGSSTACAEASARPRSRRRRRATARPGTAASAGER